MTYGETGSGKTYTMIGGPQSYADRGIIPRAIAMVFKEALARPDVGLKVYVSFLEIYNDQVGVWSMTGYYPGRSALFCHLSVYR